MSDKINRCTNCGCEQSLVGEYSYFYCERCGSKNYPDGSVEYDASHEGIEQMRDNEDFYDNRDGYRDRQDYERSKRRHRAR